jgi:putative serine protease PepD
MALTMNTACSGVEVGSVVAGSAVATAGLLSGDRIVRFGHVSIDSVRDLTHAFRVHEPGDRIEIRYERRGKIESARISLFR